MLSRWNRPRRNPHHVGTGAKPRPSPLHLERLEDRTVPAVTLTQNYTGVNFAASGGYTPPDTAGAAGPFAYVEAVNQEIRVFPDKTTNGSTFSDSMSDFWFNQGHLTNPAGSVGAGLSDTMVVWDDQIQRFIVGDQDVDFTSTANGGHHVSAFFLAVSKSATPATLSTQDWTFYSINTTENSSTTGYTNNFDADYPGNFGYNAGAFVFTLNMFGPASATDGGPPDDAGAGAGVPSGPGGGGGIPINAQAHVQVITVDATALKNGTALTSGTNLFQSDYNGFHLRPTTMHDGTTTDPMWFVKDDRNGSQIDVVKMTGVLSNSPTFTTTTLSVNPFTEVPDFGAVGSGVPLQPDGTAVTNHLDSRILKAAEANHMLVATQQVTNAAGDRDLARWYAIDLGSSTPVIHDQGNVTSVATGAGQANVYDIFPGIDINAGGAIGMSFMQSGTGTGQYVSMYVTGRVPGDPAGTMETPVLVPAGTGVQNYSDFAPSLGFAQRAGDMSGINVDADGSFWAANEFADGEKSFANGGLANWGTAIAHFRLPSVDLAVTLTPLVPGAPENGTVTYHITVTNNGPNDDTNVTLTAPVPAGASFVSVSPTFTGYNSTTGKVNLGTIAAHGSITGDLTVRLGEGGTYPSAASVTGDLADLAPGNNTANASVAATDAPLTGQGTSLTSTAGAPFSGAVAGLIDAFTAAPLTDFTATINWGDGTSSTGTVSGPTGGPFTVNGGHTYASAARFTVIVTVRDVDGAAVRVVSQFNVTAAAQPIGAQVGTVTFWTGTNGQTLIDSFGGSASSTLLASWLATSFPNLYGASLGGGGRTNIDVAALVVGLAGSASTRAEAEILATALNVYATTASLGGGAGATYGFVATAAGLGAATWNVGTNGVALNLANNTTYTVWRLLRSADGHATAGRLIFATTDGRYGYVFNIFHGINGAGSL